MVYRKSAKRVQLEEKGDKIMNPRCLVLGEKNFLPPSKPAHPLMLDSNSRKLPETNGYKP